MTIFVTSDLARFCTRQDRVPEAVELGARALAAARRALPTSHPDFPTVLLPHGAALVEAERFEAARPVIEEAQALRAAGASAEQAATVRDLLARARAGGGPSAAPPRWSALSGRTSVTGTRARTSPGSSRSRRP